MSRFDKNNGVNESDESGFVSGKCIAMGVCDSCRPRRTCDNYQVGVAKRVSEWVSRLLKRYKKRNGYGVLYKKGNDQVLSRGEERTVQGVQAGAASEETAEWDRREH